MPPLSYIKLWRSDSLLIFWEPPGPAGQQGLCGVQLSRGTGPDLKGDMGPCPHDSPARNTVCRGSGRPGWGRGRAFPVREGLVRGECLSFGATAIWAGEVFLGGCPVRFRMFINTLGLHPPDAVSALAHIVRTSAVSGQVPGSQLRGRLGGPDACTEAFPCSQAPSPTASRAADAEEPGGRCLSIAETRDPGSECGVCWGRWDSVRGTGVSTRPCREASKPPLVPAQAFPAATPQPRSSDS